MKNNTKKITITAPKDRFFVTFDFYEGEQVTKSFSDWASVIGLLVKETEHIPQAFEIEASVLGAILIEKTAMDECTQILNPDMFYTKSHNIIYRAMEDSYRQGEPIDTVTIHNVLKKREQLDEVGGGVYLSRLSQNISSAANIEYWCKILAEKWMLRRLMELGESLIKESLVGSEDAFELMSYTTEKIYEIENHLSGYEQDKTLWGEFPRIIGEVEEKYTSKKKQGLQSDSFPSLNRATGGIMKDFIIVYGQEKQGKTSFSERLLLDFSLQGLPVGAFTMEMDLDTYIQKALSMEADIEYLKLRNPAGNGLEPHEFQNFLSRAQRFRKTNIFIDDKTFDFERMIGKAKLWKRKYDVKVLLFDYIGLIESNKRHEKKYIEVAYYTRRLKALTKELQIPIIAVSQANQENKTADSKGALRDCDFAVSVRKPVDAGITSIKNKFNDVFVFNDTHFLATVENSRHGRSKQNFVCGFANNNFREIDIDSRL
jgi:replicative DNA helicase